MSRAFLIGAGATKAEYRDAPLSKNFFKFVGRQDKELFKAIKDTIEPHISQPLQKSNVEDDYY
ncbi:MAG: hypothetical protein B5M53_00750 [Candidatus Cloacimonas sp. 4484_209]|nr:MAG: hypothetical protein B5M53_00750 [Candidatus Cloacimonas sp. 4484_209]